MKLVERVYLDTNVYCRPLDNQSDSRIQAESEAFLKIVDIALGESRVATIIGSPYVPQSKEYFTITEKGIEDVQRQNS